MDHTVALDGSGTVWSWGTNSSGQLGNGTTTNSFVPAPISAPLPFAKVVAGDRHNVALAIDGTVWTWGFSGMGSLGYETSQDQLVPRQVDGLIGIVDVTAGAYSSVAVTSDGHVWCWGSGWCIGGQVPGTPVMVGVTNVKQVVAGIDYFIALTTTGDVLSWGQNSRGQLGIGSTTATAIPTQISGLQGIATVSAGLAHSTALSSTGQLYAWGSNYFGSVGDGSGIDRLTPVAVPGLSTVRNVWALGDHTLAIDSRGLWSWGLNSLGQLGVGDTNDRYLPTLVREGTPGSDPVGESLDGTEQDVPAAPNPELLDEPPPVPEETPDVPGVPPAEATDPPATSGEEGSADASTSAAAASTRSCGSYYLVGPAGTLSVQYSPSVHVLAWGYDPNSRVRSWVGTGYFVPTITVNYIPVAGIPSKAAGWSYWHHGSFGNPLDLQGYANNRARRLKTGDKVTITFYKSGYGSNSYRNVVGALTCKIP